MFPHLVEDARRAAELRDAPSAATVAPPKLDHSESAKIRAAAGRAPKIYPGPVGLILERELLAWHDFGYRIGIGSKALMAELVQHLLTAPEHRP